MYSTNEFYLLVQGKGETSFRQENKSRMCYSQTIALFDHANVQNKQNKISKHMLRSDMGV